MENSFRYSPGTHPKIERDALHFLLSFQIEKTVRDGTAGFVPIRWKLISLEGMSLEVHTEFLQNNHHIYCEQTPQALIAESPVH
jgi:hypothetical protein